MNRELLNMKKSLLRANTPSREKEIAKALKVAFKSIGEGESFESIYDGMNVKDAYKIIGWCD